MSMQNTPHQSTPKMPGVVTAARVILFVVSGLSGVLLVMSLLVIIAAFAHPAGAEEIFAAGGETTGGILTSFVLGLTGVVLMLVAGLRIGRGGKQNHLVVRILVGASGLLSVLDAFLAGQSTAFMGILLPLAVLMMIQTKRSQEWFAEMDSAR
ncbi:hypothetical protein [Nocardiopsis ganjiahuensis]|uniref:hypothetical protein n=1 Tax=Nocardiopsis ganjiahuensis TaxID=239984 RepID=UPI0003488764|nr:hypothetical protein [Nocardiopsis ganjiahuensis]